MDKAREITEKISATLTEIEREYSSIPYVSVVCAAFVLYIAHQTPEKTDLKDILSANKVSAVLTNAIVGRIGEHWDRYRPLLTAFSRADLADFFENFVDGDRIGGNKGSPFSSSMPVADLVIRLLELKAGESVCDLGCASGDFLRRAYGVTHAEDCGAVCAGFEIDSGVAAVAAIRMHCEELDVSVRNDSVFAAKHLKVRYDKVFCDAPFCERGLVQDPEVKAFVRTAYPDFPELNAGMTGDWLFAARAVAAMKKGGRAAVVLSPSAMFDGRNEPFRRYFVQRNLVEAVVELPPRLFTHTNVSAYLVLFAEECESVKMVRAADLCYSNRKSNVLGRDHVETIAACLGRVVTGSAESPNIAAICDRSGLDAYRTTVLKQRLLEGGCELTVSRYFNRPEPVGNSIPLGSLVTMSKRGFNLTARELDGLVCEEDTACMYLAPGDINDGVIAPDADHLNEIPRGAEAYAAKNGDLVITRVMASSAGVKAAVVDLPDGVSALPNGNLFVIAVDPERADPYFIKAWIDSAVAQRYLEAFSSGSAVRTLSYKNLETLPVPALPLERQREIGRACKEAVRRYVELRDGMAEAKAALGRVFEDVASDCLS